MSTGINTGISVFLVSLFSSLGFVYLFRTLAVRFAIVDKPDGAIKTQKKPVPYLGGLGVYCGFMSGLVLGCVYIDNMIFCLLGVTLLLFLGLLDDLVVLKPYQKFGGQLVVVFCFLTAGIYSKEHFFSNYGNILISTLWILTLVNGFNLVDVMDGLATTIAVGASGSFLVAAILFEQFDMAFFLVAFTGALLGFFWYNRPQATIYLGDAGSLFIGGVLAIVPFFLRWGTYNMQGYLTPLVFLLVPLSEVSFLIIIRTYKGIPFYKGSPDHFCHYLQRRGWSKWAVLILVFSILMASGFLGNIYAIGQMSLEFLVLFVLTGALTWVSVVYSSIFKCAIASE